MWCWGVQLHTQAIIETLQNNYAVHEEFPHLRKTEWNWLSNEWNKMKGSLQITVDHTICEQVFKQKRHIAYGKKSVDAESAPKT